jgi:hypothetical protein
MIPIKPDLNKLLSPVVPILNQSAIFVGVVVGFLNVFIIRLVASA